MLRDRIISIAVVGGILCSVGSIVALVVANQKDPKPFYWTEYYWPSKK